MTANSGTSSQPASAIPPDDSRRYLALARPESDQKLPHLGVVGDTYTIILTGEDTAGRFSLIDMHVPPGGGPPPRRHDFEETFTLLEGELEVSFRGAKSVVRAGETVNIPANAPHQFHNSSTKPVRMLCTCSPAGQEAFFLEVGVPRRNTHNATAPSRRDSASGVQKEIRSPGPKISHRAPSTPLNLAGTRAPGSSHKNAGGFARLAGVPPWLLRVDPAISFGFSQQEYRRSSFYRGHTPAVNDLMVLNPSRS